MNWKLKAFIQNCVALLPSSISYSTYYFIQRHFGNLKEVNPTRSFETSICVWNLIKKQGIDPLNKAFFEIGTGRIAAFPLAIYLMGGGKTVTIDLNPYLKGELVEAMLDYVFSHEQEIITLFGPALDKQRFERLREYYSNVSFLVRTFLELCNIKYIAPGNAAETGLKAESVDFHVSITVFEHIPANVLIDILKEGNRIVKKGGLFIHKIDYSDHFSHSDKSISSINFLKYSDEKWGKLAGNRFMYMNRLRHDDYLQLFKSADQDILLEQGSRDIQAVELLNLGKITLNNRFLNKTKDVLSIIGAWIISRKQVK